MSGIERDTAASSPNPDQGIGVALEAGPSRLSPSASETLVPEPTSTVLAAQVLENRDSGTDLDAALRLARNFGDVLRYANGVGWLFWDGKRWSADSDHQVTNLAMQSARMWTLEAVNYKGAGSQERYRQASALEGASRIKNACELARSLTGIRIEHSDLDRNGWLLNCRNGTADLTSGKLRPHRKEDLITKLAEVDYQPNATHPALEHFLGTIGAHNPDLPGFLARCFGATLTGDPSVETLFVLQGEGGSGKTTLTESVASLMGDYSCKLPFESLCRSKFGRQGGSATPDLIPMRGARLVYATEGDANSQLDAGKLKELSGAEPVTLRALYEEPITVEPTWKIWLVSNFDPRTNSEDTGLWRRLVKLQFAAIPEAKRDVRIKELLASDDEAKSAVLAWAVKGSLEWQRAGRGRTGLRIPISISDATEAYRSKQDTLAAWWDELTTTAILCPTSWTAAKDIRGNYRQWCENEGVMEVSPPRLTAYLEKNGLKTYKGSGGTRGWLGISL
jgi:putative DNA primase/helicase